MDSKLINSNIAVSNRVELILEALRHYVKSLKLKIYRKDFKKDEYAFLEVLQNKTVTNITYSLSGNQKQVLLERLGPIIGKLLSISMSQSESYRLLKQVFEEQFEAEEENKDQGDDSTEDMRGDGVKKQVPRAPKDIGSDTIQSVHDPEAKFRTKGHGRGKQHVWGYHANITESCEKEDGLNLIIDTEVVEANVSEDVFLIPSIEQSKKVLGESINEVITDGAYDSIENRKQMLEPDKPNLSIAKMKGGKHRYEMEYDEGQNLQVKEKENGSRCEVSYSKRANKYVIKSKNGYKRYMTQQEVDNYFLHQKITKHANDLNHNLRANVESTIHQVFHRLKKRNKMVYRGKIKCQWYVLSRAFWVNLTRISQKELENALILPVLMLRALIMALSRNNKNLLPLGNTIEIL
jgi:hypothetical protein